MTLWYAQWDDYIYYDVEWKYTYDIMQNGITILPKMKCDEF